MSTQFPSLETPSLTMEMSLQSRHACENGVISGGNPAPVIATPACITGVLVAVGARFSRLQLSLRALHMID